MSTLPSATETARPIMKKAPFTIIFPYNFNKRKFEIKGHLPEMSNKSPSTEDITHYLSEIEHHLKDWHNASGKDVVFILSAIIAIPMLIFVFFVLDSIIPVYRAPIKIFIISVVTFFLLYAGSVILSVYQINRAQIIQEIVEKFNNDLDKTACSDIKNDYTWIFPMNFPAYIALCRERKGNIEEDKFYEEEEVETIDDISLQIRY